MLVGSLYGTVVEFILRSDVLPGFETIGECFVTLDVLDQVGLFEILLGVDRLFRCG